MTTSLKSVRKTAKNSTAAETPKTLPISGDIYTEDHAKVIAAAKAGERTTAAQLRIIVKKWAETQPTPPKA